MADVLIGECRVKRINGLTPDEDALIVDRADPHVLVAEELLANLDERWAHFGDGILTIHGRDGDVSYGLSHHDPYRRVFLGTRAD